MTLRTILATASMILALSSSAMACNGLSKQDVDEAMKEQKIESIMTLEGGKLAAFNAALAQAHDADVKDFPDMDQVEVFAGNNNEDRFDFLAAFKDSCMVSRAIIPDADVKTLLAKSQASVVPSPDVLTR